MGGCAARVLVMKKYYIEASSKSSLVSSGIGGGGIPAVASPLACMLFFNGLATLTGAFCHQNFTSTDLITDGRNLLVFRIVWTVCVASVGLAGAAMGVIAYEIHKGMIGNRNPELISNCNQQATIGRFSPKFISSEMWLLYGLIMALTVIRGDYSCFRPAADIFLAGITVALPTVYLLGIAGWCFVVGLRSRSIGTSLPCGQGAQERDDASSGSAQEQFSGNLPTLSTLDLCLLIMYYLFPAPTVTLYPVLLTAEMPLGAINFSLHCMLAFVWIGQWWITEKIFIRPLLRNVNVKKMD